jgi:AraC-like DNA-binding protein
MDGDIVSGVLRAVRLTGAVFFDVEAAAPWAAEAPPTADFAALVMPGSAHVIEYHVVVSGRCWATRLGEPPGEPVPLEAGSVIVFPHGDPHVMASAPGLRAEPSYEVLRCAASERRPFLLQQGGDGPAAHVICGFLGCDALPFNPLLQALPRQIHIADGATGWLGSLIEATLAESRNRRLGGGGVLTRLSELIFIEVIRRYAESLPPRAAGWLAALDAPHVGRALRLIHAEPARDWSLGILAREVGASRSVLAERFTASLGVPPRTYLQNWRMQIAEGLLAGGGASLAEIAARVGYESDVAFSRAFKRCTGVSPSERRRAREHAA